MASNTENRQNEYWRAREEEALRQRITDEVEYQRRIDQIYADMLESCQSEIDRFYRKYAEEESISLAEAKKRVSRLDIEAYERKAERYVKEKNFSKEANAEMRLYNATMKINRLEMLKANIGLELISGHDELEKFMEKILQGRTEDELKRQAGILGDTIRNNAKTAHSIVNASFHNASFSERIWMYQDLLKADLAKLLQSGMIQGKNPRVLARELESKFGSSRSDAERLMRTELARVQTDAQRQSFENMGFDEYTFHANSNCCDACQALNGKHFKVKDMMPGENAAPIHPGCRCSCSAYEDSDEYEAWLDYLSKGGTAEEWNAMKAGKGGKGTKAKAKSSSKAKSDKENVAQKATKTPAKSDKIELTKDSFSSPFTDKKEWKNTEKFIEYINGVDGADQNLLKLYNSIGKIEKFKDHGIKFSIAHGKNHAVRQSWNAISGKVVEVKLTIPKLKGNNIAGQINTMVHENMHLIDLMLRKYPAKAGSFFAASNSKFSKAFTAIDDSMGKDMDKLFKDFKDEYNSIREKYRAELKAGHAELEKQYLPNGIWGLGADYSGYKKAYNKLIRENEEARDYECRNIMGGGVNALQDIYDALSGGRYRDNGTVLYGHGSKYYRSTDSRIDETIANYASLSLTRPDLVEMLRKDKPELVKALDELVIDMGRKVDEFDR